MMRRTAAARILLLAASFALLALGQVNGKEPTMAHPIFYRTTRSMDSRSFIERPVRKTRRRFSCYTGFQLPRGSSNRSSRGWLIAFILVAPDYPGFGHSDWPDPKKFSYTFDHIAETMNHFTEALGLSRYTLYMHDYGGPVGFRMALAHPERVEALIVQDAAGHNEGLGANWKTRREFWKDRAANETALRTNLLSLADDEDAPCRKRSQCGTLRPRSMD